mmetsp:Transcript_38702/g.93562  ORF Transcript_38702/g.93562 Transcript_38702/m.93562 type:complete len:271 (+) Transcript_38702:170-982(+)|eukprot:CAMPEP_0113638616 /NCGR_PEP_ID=MMETSP0017_2-20120614/20235_1 /TAXON_ID=2856 /ORGANISM="Cylindrotheca closterium" /LENGTH=270 /DNA_ID=CAMNT_0000549743 /DNA_START=64 /DNA_END=876 /DNA_ORIENTATION=+ /assembly_acc=CAM_ASM_000147
MVTHHQSRRRMIPISEAFYCLLLLLTTLSSCSEALEGTCKANGDCLHNGYCHEDSNHPSVYDSKCICTQDYTGPYCETPRVASAKDCVVDTDCQNGGTCIFVTATTTTTETQGICDCPSDHYGYHCQEKCPCQNGATCKTEYSSGSYECQCTEEFYGPHCLFRWDGEREEGEEEGTTSANAMLISILGISFGIFFCLVFIGSSSRGVSRDDENGKHRVGVERMADGSIAYRGDGEDDEAEGVRVPATPRTDPVIEEEDTEPDHMTDLELT